ncbi:uncharacterized protein EAE97_003156 [Botrytis byssoidea]|uniref:Uncharacterized protein n=1 Tax=Botrytis byssoidea TaxID=139641 RepID=A0A9P5IUX5_9HELO|nr:uncharacterized protein EAE97_003156 [Botrytis byssoidea]KAF7949647.1 hypothetical protein EAE97_003156 [Botrytis byssoidea]
MVDSFTLVYGFSSTTCVLGAKLPTIPKVTNDDPITRSLLTTKHTHDLFLLSPDIAFDIDTEAESLSTGYCKRDPSPSSYNFRPQNISPSIYPSKKPPEKNIITRNTINIHLYPPSSALNFHSYLKSTSDQRRTQSYFVMENTTDMYGAQFSMLQNAMNNDTRYDANLDASFCLGDCLGL